MPVSVVIGGQFGSEGKGKVSLHLVRRDPSIEAVVRVGGSNSGHTGISLTGQRVALRQLPAGAIDGRVKILIPAGSYIDFDVLMSEIDLLGYDPSLITVSPLAHVITDAHKAWERACGLNTAIGSTQSGTGAAVLSRIGRGVEGLPRAVQAADVTRLQRFLGDTTRQARAILRRGGRIVVEGTQGFGLSAIHAEAWPKATSRDTTAAGFISEAGLSPLDVDDIIMVLRCHPIRVAGEQAGPLPRETTWAKIAEKAAIHRDLTEFTTVTRVARRVGEFDNEIVRKAIEANQPTRIVLNHLDYIDPQASENNLSSIARKFVDGVAEGIGQTVDWVGTSPDALVTYAANEFAVPS